jgi:Ca2+-dependent lipid-binding protein
MSSRLNQSIEVELWHTDRLKTDTLLGKVQVQLARLLEMPLRTTSESYARVLDAFLPIDEIN